jgi:hypothetical protein
MSPAPTEILTERLGATRADLETLAENGQTVKLRVFICRAPRP